MIPGYLLSKASCLLVKVQRPHTTWDPKWWFNKGSMRFPRLFQGNLYSLVTHIRYNLTRCLGRVALGSWVGPLRLPIEINVQVGRQLARLLDKSFSGWPQFLDAYVSREGERKKGTNKTERWGVVTCGNSYLGLFDLLCSIYFMRKQLIINY